MKREHRHSPQRARKEDIAHDVLLKPEAKRAFVRQMFDGIARRYDLLNHLLSMGIDIVWRKKTIDQLQPGPNWRILDLATGTGDLGFECGKRAGDIQVIGVDPSMPMLREGEKKNASRANPVAFLCGEGECLPFGEGTFDGVTIGFGIRNVAELETALSEMCRVLKVGGRVAVLEFSRPRTPVFRGLYNFYFQRILPRIGHMVSRDPNAYRYLYESVMRFPEGADFCRRLSDAGFVDIQAVRLSFGIATIYLASKS
ncbi:MAG: bifunctional demethylmenaquinone methyltransferase/2-methoxy-6-polyprenyl-1,4-benzoquinol methylase UbiE [Candidatus Latescibacteria bacterium]|nr:bifunctional demethylmenaquinone methyltransferase/2-methoxy-6-polyprenyl-1,4-benzoquinol methylase UbiE [Candidatus Latescibacterota bacterium]